MKKINNPEPEDSYTLAAKRVKKIKGFYMHVAVYLVVNIFILAQIYTNTSKSENLLNFGNFSTAVFWGIGLVAHGISVFGQDLLFGSAWEQRQIRKYMEEEKREKWE